MARHTGSVARRPRRPRLHGHRYGLLAGLRSPLRRHPHRGHRRLPHHFFDAPAPPPGDPTCVSSGSTTIHSVGEFGYSDIRSAGHIEFLPGQAHVFTDDASSEAKVAGYVAAPGTNLGDTFVVDWSGTGVAPAAQIALSDGSLGGGSILVFEAVYGADDLWLTNSSAQELKDNAPDTSVGSGSPWHGTPAAWQGVLDDLGYTVIGMGFSLGSGVLSDGTLTEVTAGCTPCSSTPQPLPPGDPTCVSSGSTTIHSVGEFGYSDIRSAGHIEFLPGEAHVFTDDACSEAQGCRLRRRAGHQAGRHLRCRLERHWCGAGRPDRTQRRIAGRRIDPRVRGPSTGPTICG